jgi:hypothetical protein
MVTLAVGGIGMSAPVQGGIGAYHILVSKGLTLLFGINPENALTYATMVHASQTLLVMLTGGLSVIIIFYASRKYRK